ncbi:MULTISPECIES: hypothetical protein [unclassified Microcystis]|nr:MULTISPECIES: hypothetical protein [unclassified Microcystis]MCZ8200260.1 hypothetical protein [Microcystis sp. LE19-55.1A]MCZ8305602.1 hypothetical protein [Microcystis sp. LE19-98.1E]
MKSIETLEIPVIIAHFGGKPNYLKFALKSAANFNNTVVLIGNDTNKGFWGNHWDTTLVEFDKYQNFQKCYVQMSDYSGIYEIAMWKRMFVLEEWMKENGYQRVFLLDSDIMTFANYSEEVYPVLPNDCIAALMTSTPKNQDTNFRWASTSSFSYWTLEGLENFTDFCIEAYSNKNIPDKLKAKWQWHIDNHKPGGICDMTLLYLWSKDNSKVANLTRAMNDMTPDYNINSSTNYLEDEYQMQFGLKKLIFKNGIPYGYNKNLNKEIKFLCIHCQGRAKSVMRFLYYKQLRDFYYIGNLVQATKAKMKLLIKKIISNK